MIEFGLIFGAGVLSLFFAAVLGHPLLRRATRLRLITSARDSAFATDRSYLGVQLRALLAIASLVTIAAFVGIGLVRTHDPSDPASSSYTLAAWCIGSLLFGAASTALAIHLAVHASARATPRLGDASKSGLHEVVWEGMRSASASTLTLSAILLLGFSIPAIAAFSVAGGFDPGEDRLAASHTMAALIASHAFGAVITSIIASNIGGVILTASASTKRPSHLESPLTRVADLGSSIPVVLAATTISFAHAGTSEASAAALAPSMTLAFGLLSSAVGLFIVRVDAKEMVSKALDRGFIVTLILVAASLLGMAHWLFDDGWWRMFLAACCGLIATPLVVFLERILLRRNAKDGGCSSEVNAWGLGLQHAALVGLAAIAAAVTSFVLGGSTEVDHGSSIGLGFAALAAIAPAPYLLATSTFGSMVRRCVLAAQSDLTRLESATQAGASTWSYTALCTAMVVWVAVSAFTGSNEVGPWASEKLGVAMALCSVAAGAILILWQSTAALRAVTATLRSLTQQGAHNEFDSPSLSANKTQQTGLLIQEGVRNGIPIIVLMMGIPVLFFTGLRLAWSEESVVVAATAAMVLGASFTGLMLSTGSHHIRNISENTNSYKPKAVASNMSVDEGTNCANNAHDGVVVEGAVLGRALQSLVGPSIHASVKLLATAALAIAPLFL